MVFCRASRNERLWEELDVPTAQIILRAKIKIKTLTQWFSAQGQLASW